MGISHATCCISGLPIQQKEPARLVFLVKTPDGEGADAGYTTGHSLWTPWAVPIAGIYNGEGSLTLRPGWHSTFIQERLDEVVVERGTGANPFIDKAVSKEDIAKDKGLQNVQEHIRGSRIRVFADVDNKIIAPLGMTFIREDVYTTLVETPAFTKESILTAKGAIDREMGIMQKNQKNPLHSGDAAASLKILEGTVVGNQIAETLKNLMRYRRLTGTVGSYGSPGIRGIGGYRLFIAEKVMSGTYKNDPDLLDAVEQFGSFIHFLVHFEMLRKLWTPQNGLGSQITGWGSHVALNMVVYRIAHGEFEKEAEAYQGPPVKPTS